MEEEIIIRGEKYIKTLDNGEIILKKYYPKEKMWAILRFNEDSTDENFERIKEIIINTLTNAIV